MHRTIRELTTGLIQAATLAVLAAATPADAEWLSLLKSTMVFDEGEWDPTANVHGGCPIALAAADFDGDGHQDLVVANRNQTPIPAASPRPGTSVSVLLHTNPSGYSPGIGFWQPFATGSLPPFQRATNYPTATEPLNVRAGDLNGDGRPDIVVSSDDTLTYLLNTGLAGAARFAAPKFYACASTDGAMHVGDVNGDGTVETVVPFGFSSVRIYRGSGDSLIVVGTTAVPQFREPFTVADMNADGLQDLILYNRTGGVSENCFVDIGQIYIVPGTPQGTFDSGTWYGPYPFGLIPPLNTALTTAHLNGDPYPEVVGISLCEPWFVISQGLPGAQLGPAIAVTLPNRPFTLSAGDIDGDDDVDLVGTQYRDDFGPTSSVCVVPGNGDLTFGTPVLAPGPSRAMSAGLQDVNEDGRLDLVTTQTGALFSHTGGPEYYNHAVEVLWADGAGGFLTPVVSKLGTHCYRQAVGDFNRDGMPDIATSSSSSVMIGLGNGTGTYTPGASFGTSSPGTLVTGDLDRDGKLDLLIQYTNVFEQWRGNGDGTFLLQSGYGGTLYSRSLADMTGDGIPDVIAFDGFTLWIYEGSTGGLFSLSVVISFSPPSVGINAVQPGDWNRDGLMDVAVAGPNGLSVYLRTGPASFASEAVLRSGRSYTDVCSGDFNRDGILDLATRENGTALPLDRGIDVFLGNGSGAFATSVSYGTLDPTGYTLDTWDANLDGIPDLISSSQVNSSPSASMDILLGNGIGAFGLRTSYGLGPVDQTAAGPYVTNGDIDRDGMPDIVSGRVYTQSVADNYVQTVLATPPTYSAARQNARFFPTTNNPIDVAVGDLDRDGKLDVVTATYASNPGIAVHRGNGGGSIGAATVQAQSFYASRVRLADLNLDGTLDVIFSNNIFGPVRVSSMLGVGNLTFGPRLDYTMNVGNDMEIGDMNRDGIPDVVVATSDSIRVLTGTGSGTFQGAGGKFVGTLPYDLDLADLNRDGLLDVVCAKGNLVVLYGTGGGLLGPPTTLPAPASFCQEVCVGDVNRDGFPDIVANSQGQYYVLWGAAASPFATYQLTNLPFTAFDMTIAPMAGNGLPYLVIGRNAEWLEIVSMSPTGVLTPAFSHTISNTPESLVLADMDRDGLLDAVSVGSGGSLVAINLRGTGTVTAVQTAEAPTPSAVRLHPNYPNPFNPSTTIRFTLPGKGRVRLTVHDARGGLVTVLEDRELPAGEHSVPWRGTNADGQAVASGVYFYRLATDDGDTRSRRMVVVK